MTPVTHDRGEDEKENGQSPKAQRYPAIQLEDGLVVIYDREQHTAWIRSDNPTTLDAVA